MSRDAGFSSIFVCEMMIEKTETKKTTKKTSQNLIFHNGMKTCKT